MRLKFVVLKILIISCLTGCCDIGNEDRYFLSASEEVILERVEKGISYETTEPNVHERIKELFPSVGKWKEYKSNEPLTILDYDGKQRRYTKENQIVIWENPSTLCTMNSLKRVKLRLFFDESDSLFKIVVNRETDSL
jgi:hypothetical protein